MNAVETKQDGYSSTGYYLDIKMHLVTALLKNSKKKSGCSQTERTSSALNAPAAGIF